MKHLTPAKDLSPAERRLIVRFAAAKRAERRAKQRAKAIARKVSAIVKAHQGIRFGRSVLYMRQKVSWLYSDKCKSLAERLSDLRAKEQDKGIARTKTTNELVFDDAPASPSERPS